MTPTTIPRPGESEFAPYYNTYISLVTQHDIPRLLEQQMAQVAALRSLDDAKAAHRYAPGKWSVKEVIGHTADAERIFAYRMLRIARGDTTALASFDENMYVAGANFDSLPIGTLVNNFETARASTLALIAELDQTSWPKMGVASGHPVSVRAIAFIIAGHTSHHLAILHERYGIN